MNVELFRQKLTELLGMLDSKEESPNPFDDKDSGDGGSDSVTDLTGIANTVPSKSKASSNKRSLDIVAASMKRTLGKM